MMLKDYSGKALRLLVLTLVNIMAIYLLRAISPTVFVDGWQIYMLYLPYSWVVTQILLLGERSLLPLTLAYTASSWYQYEAVSPFSAVLLSFCILLPPAVTVILLHWRLGRRWNAGFLRFNTIKRVLLFCFVCPLMSRVLMCLSGMVFPIPASLVPYFYVKGVAFNLVSYQYLVLALVVMNAFFYNLQRFLFSDARRFIVARIWGGENPMLLRNKRDMRWAALCLVCILLFWQAEVSGAFVGYLMPFVFLLFIYGVLHQNPRLTELLWSIAIYVMMASNQVFFSAYSDDSVLAFLMSMIIVFAIALHYLAVNRRKYERQMHQTQLYSRTDPLTRLPNMRALENRVEAVGNACICRIAFSNIAVFEKYYGTAVVTWVKGILSRSIYDEFGCDIQVYDITGNQLICMVSGDREARINELYGLITSLSILWKGDKLDIDYRLSWGNIDDQTPLIPFVERLAWFSEATKVVKAPYCINDSMRNLDDEMSRSIEMIKSVKAAIENRDIEIYAQPITSREGVVYRELLSRLRIGGRIIMPDVFLPVIREFDYACEFDSAVFEKSMSMLDGHAGDIASINIMPATLFHEGIALRFINLMERYAISAERVILEITEEQGLLSSENAMNNIARLAEHGVKIAIDDFGTGQSNYERMRDITAQILKIDGVFVKDILVNKIDQMIVESICKIARAREMTVVAEYVENEEQQRLLFDMGVDHCQGFYIGKPYNYSN
ncbi:EAL domain-containing protein [Erwinia sp. CPCC 100877]|nr:EAL domain-containing protein [Erwinia sp. CPCC 100877]